MNTVQAKFNEMILSGTMHKLSGVYTLILIQSFILKLMFAFKKVVSHFALVRSNKATLKAKNVALLVCICF